jgi:hypothetical protein
MQKDHLTSMFDFEIHTAQDGAILSHTLLFLGCFLNFLQVKIASRPCF